MKRLKIGLFVIFSLLLLSLSLSALSFGDADKDGRVNNVDEAIISRFLAGFRGYELTYEQKLMLDLDNDGRVTPADGAILTRAVASWDEFDRFDAYRTRVTVDFRNADVFGELMNVYAHTPTAVEPDPDTGGRYAFSEDEEAMQVLYAESKRQPPYRVMLRFNKMRALADDDRYAVIVYRVKTDKPFKMTLWNSPGVGEEAVIAELSESSGDGYVISEPIDLLRENERGTLLSRWVTTNMNTLGISTDDTELEFYIKEISFFKTKDAARRYYEIIDLEIPPAGREKEESDSAVLLFGETESCDFYTKVGEVTSANYTRVEGSLGDALRLNYVESQKWSEYVVMPRFADPSGITAEHRYARLVYMTDDTSANAITLRSNNGGGKVTLVENTAASKGFYTVSPIIDLTPGGNIIERYMAGYHNTFEFTGTDPEKPVYLKEMRLFTSEKEAAEFYGDSNVSGISLTFGEGSNSAYYMGSSFGKFEVNEIEGTVDITYAEHTNFSNVHFMVKTRFKKESQLPADYKFVRVLYCADIPSGESGLAMKLRNDGGVDLSTLSDSVSDTDGKYILTDAVEISDGMVERLNKPMHASLYITSNDEDAVFKIKAIYFFPTKWIADQFTYVENRSSVYVDSNDISFYSVIVSENAGDSEYAAAQRTVKEIYECTGVRLPILYDSARETENEILVGKTNRALSEELYDGYSELGDYSVAVDDGKIAICAFMPPSLGDAVNAFAKNLLYKGLTRPYAIHIEGDEVIEGSSSALVPANVFEIPENVSVPEVITDSFECDTGLISFEEGKRTMTVKDGRLITDRDGGFGYIHVYESGTELSADVSTDDRGGVIGLAARYNAEDAFVRAGYDLTHGKWFIENREGNDFYLLRLAERAENVDFSTPVTLKLTVSGTTARLYANGRIVLQAYGVTHTSPGRSAIYSDGCEASFDNLTLTLLTGEGTVKRGTAHTKLDKGVYMEGGSAWELKDGSVLFEHNAGAWKSYDSGYTWEETEKQMGVTGYPSIIRLDNGDLLRVGDNENGYKVAKISTDDGRTWSTVGRVCPRYYQLDGKDTTAGAGNMNDKLFVSATTGRIFYGQNYEGGPVDGRTVFCEFYYSDDNGRTWTKSETDSWEIDGNENEAYFGECKLLECADGSIRVYNSWGRHGCIVYAESFDNGKTFGPLVKMTDFPSTQSSMQFVRDPYADNETTYYMVWVNCTQAEGLSLSSPRSRLTLAYSEDGKNWTRLGDVWRWEGNYLAPNTKAFINQIVDPFIQVTPDTVIVGSGFSEQICVSKANDNTFHQAQREHIFTFDKNLLHGAD